LIKNALPRGSGVFLKMVVTITALLCSHLRAYTQPVQISPEFQEVGVTLPVTLQWTTASTVDYILVKVYRLRDDNGLELVYEKNDVPNGTTELTIPMEQTNNGEGVNFINQTYYWSVDDGSESLSIFTTTADENEYCLETFLRDCDDGYGCTKERVSFYKDITTNDNYVCAECQLALYQPTFENYNFTFIESVALNGPSTINNFGDDSGYGDYTGTVLAMLSATNTITLTPGFNAPFGDPLNWGIWIDVNQDDIFQASEQVYTGSSIDEMTSVMGTFNAPYGTGTRTMRVVMVANDTPAPCGEFPHGETEDYTVALCPGDSDGDGICNTNDSCYGTSSDEDGDYICDDEDICLNDPTNSCIGDYCEVVGGGYESIESVELNGSISTITNNGNDNAYGDYTGPVLARVGSMNTIEVTASSLGLRCGVWIDFNKDGDFDDAGEEVVNVPQTTVYRFDFFAPPGIGTTTMRVVVEGDDDAVPCYLASGEAEDYTVALSADCPPYLTIYDFDVSGDYNASDFTQTDDALDAEVTVNTAEQLELSGGNRVRLNNGFSVASGGTLRADNEDCSQ